MERIAMPRLSVRDLEIVLALAHAQSTVKAASSLHITQSAVSRALCSVEEKLGTPVFERTGRALVPTAAGERLIAGAGDLLVRLVDLERTVVDPEPVQRVRIVCECYTAYRWLPSALANLGRETASLDVALAIEHTSKPVDALRSNAIDIALLTMSPVRAPLRELPLFQDELVFLLSRTHPLAGVAKLRVDDILEHPVITSTQTPTAEARWFMTKVFGRRRPRLERLRLPLTDAIVDAARAGLGIAPCSEWIAGPYLQDPSLVCKRLEGRPLQRAWRMAYRPEMAEAAGRLAAALIHAAPRPLPPT